MYAAGARRPSGTFLARRRRQPTTPPEPPPGDAPGKRAVVRKTAQRLFVRTRRLPRLSNHAPRSLPAVLSGSGFAYPAANGPSRSHPTVGRDPSGPQPTPSVDHPPVPRRRDPLPERRLCTVAVAPYRTRGVSRFRGSRGHAGDGPPRPRPPPIRASASAARPSPPGAIPTRTPARGRSLGVPGGSRSGGRTA